MPEAPDGDARESAATPATDGGPARTPEQRSALTWSGEIPYQKWMNFYTKVLTKLGVGGDLTLTVKVEC